MQVPTKGELVILAMQRYTVVFVMHGYAMCESWVGKLVILAMQRYTLVFVTHGYAIFQDYSGVLY
jgi:hypothetical protein